MEKFVEGMSLRGESLLAFQEAYPGLNLALIILGGGLILALIVWALLGARRKGADSQKRDGE